MPDIAREDPTAASPFKAELQALVSADGPSKEMPEGWRERFAPPRGTGRRMNNKRSNKTEKSGGQRKRAVKHSEADASTEGEAP